MDRKKHYQHRASIGVLVMTAGIASGLAYDNMTGQPPGHGPSIIAALMISVGAVGWVYGTCCYAMSKGRAWQWGLLGLTSWPGLLVLLMLRERESPAHE